MTRRFQVPERRAMLGGPRRAACGAVLLLPPLGNDRLFDRDALPSGARSDRLEPGFDVPGEVADCGSERDTAILGPGDRARGGENVRRP